MRVLRRWWPLLAVAVLLAASGASASMSRLPLSRVTFGTEEVFDQERPEFEHRTVSPAPEAIGSGFELPSWVPAVVGGIAAVIVLAIVVLFVGASLGSGPRFQRRAVRRPEPVRSKLETVEAEVVAALDAGLLGLDEAGADPRRTVIACWVRLEKAAAAAGTTRLPGDTATDLLLRLLAGHRLSEPVLTGFADVYRIARYAPRHQIDERMREHAKAALSRLRGELIEVPSDH